MHDRDIAGASTMAAGADGGLEVMGLTSLVAPLSTSTTL